GRSAYEGSGIGLAICRKVVERHNGVISARSLPGEGTTFVITLPRKQTGGNQHQATTEIS
ncbi:MAG: ATP-binding protein, partial [Syntrophobacteraceae bacterium]